MTHEKYCELVYQRRNDIEIIGQFTSYKDKIRVKCKKHQYEFDTWTTNLTRNKYICPICFKERLSEIKTLSHNEFITRLSEINPNIIIMSQYQNMRTKVHCKCKIDGYEWDALPTNLIDKESGCPLCAASVVVQGVNDIWTTNPEFGELLVNKNDGFVNSVHSHEKVKFRCPNCNSISSKIICNVYYQGFSCPICSDGISYPNKFMYNLLKQLDIKFTKEYSPHWASGRKYDFYIPDKNIIIEMDGGLGHGHKSFMGKITPEESKKIDNLKDLWAKQHNIDVVRIDCQHSKHDYIKNNICNSKLNTVFNLDNIDWDLIEKHSVKSILFSISEEMNNKSTLEDICQKLDLCKSTVRKYAKIAINLGIAKELLTNYMVSQNYNQSVRSL